MMEFQKKHKSSLCFQETHSEIGEIKHSRILWTNEVPFWVYCYIYTKRPEMCILCGG